MLAPCPRCRRHVKRPSATCPFCGERDLAVVPVPRGLQVRRVAGALAIGATLAACSTTADDRCVRDQGGVVAEYGAPPRCGDPDVDAGGDADASDGRVDGASDTLTDADATDATADG